MSCNVRPGSTVTLRCNFVAHSAHMASIAVPLSTRDTFPGMLIEIP